MWSSGCCVIFFVSLFSFTYQQFHKHGDEHKWIWKNGDIMLKGLFPITTQDGGKCERLFSNGVAWMMAMLYAVNKINNSTSLLPNKTIGYEIENTCESIPKSMSYAIQIVSKYRPNSICKGHDDCCQNASDARPGDKRISAVIGPAVSWISIPVARLLGLYGIPQISYASTSRILGDKTRYNSFLRTVPSDEYQAQAMAEFVHHFQWNYVFLIASDDDYGKMGAAAFKTAAKNLSVCIANDEYIAFGSPNADRQIEDTLFRLKSTERAKVVVVFSYFEQGERLLKQAEKMELTDRTWVTSDGWNSLSSELANMNVSEAMLEGLFSFSIRSKQVEEFERFVRELSIRDALSQNNSWFTRYLEENLNCEVLQNAAVSSDSKPLQLKKTCNLDAVLPPDHELGKDFVANVIDAVFVIAHAIHDILTCNASRPLGRCPNLTLPITPETLFEFASSVEFLGVDYNKVQFDKDGERIASDYVIRNLQLNNENRFQYVDVGYWSKNNQQSSFSVNETLIKWNSGRKPLSTCFRECQPGERVVGQSECCWNCQKCDKGTVSFKSGSLSCTVCDDSHYANAERTQCIVREVVYTKSSDPAGISIITVSCVGIAVLTVVAVIFLRERNTPVIMWSSPYLLILFFITLYLSFITSITQVTIKPTDGSCIAASVLLLIIFVLYAAFFLAKSKTATQLLQSAVSHLTDMRTAYLQLLEVGVVVLLQAVLIIAWQATSLSVVRYQNQDDNTRLLECYESFPVAHIIAFSFPIVVLVLATLLAFRERRLPDNFNEAKSMSFSTIALCILLVAFIPTYRFVVGNNRILVVAFTLFFAVFACMGCVFIPKLYIIFFKSEINTVVTNHETVDQYVTHPGPSPNQATSETQLSQDQGHVNHGATFGLTNGRTTSQLSRDSTAPINELTEEKVATDNGPKQIKGKETGTANEDEISSISEVLAYAVV
ncbi:extracellular calcium-sensing receptor-like [Orbicella faveolata]|uniref:extracellular calcium-sensing receptor-like n=1 Tax=Orbicella faveolata TaxID=48498 RepID=UPI0009E329E2|nr:extracellular calcium-sensing receptor-like [Orbicella faveolata]